MKQCWFSILIFNPSLIKQVCRPSLPAKSAGRVCRPSLPAKSAGIVCRPSLPAKSTGQVCRPSLPAKSAEQVCRPSLPAKSAGQVCRPSLPAKSAGQVPNGGPKWGSQMGVPNQGHISPSVLKCQNVKMIKWPNDQMTKWRDRRSECAKSDSKAYGTTCRPTALRAVGKNWGRSARQCIRQRDPNPQSWTSLFRIL
jgi:hypothetical protein